MVRISVLPRSILARLFVAALVCLAVAGCDEPKHGADAGKLTITFAPQGITTADLVITAAELHVARLQVFGDVPPSGPPIDPDQLDLDPTATSATPLVYTMLRQGLYSRVRFDVAHVTVDGTWRGTPLSVELGRPPMGGPGGGPPDANQVDLRSSVGKDLGPDEDVDFTVTLDGNGWFAGAVLDTAMSSSGEIRCNLDENRSLADMLFARVLASFTLS